MEPKILCPICSGPTTLRGGSRGSFYGCNSFPRCRGSIDAVKALSAVPTIALVDGQAPPECRVSTVTGSPEQESIWQELTTGTSHVVVKALAGTGKSFTCRHGMAKLPTSTRILYLAFNKSIAQEFREGAPRNAEVSTLNAAGFRIVKAAFPKVLLDNDKVQNLLAELYQPTTPAEIQGHKTLISAVEKLVALCQGYLLDGHEPERVLELADKHEVELDDDITQLVLSLVPRVLELSRERTGVVSFNDQLWLPVVLNLPTQKYDVIFVDEFQDLNLLQHYLVMRMLANGGRVVVVGDDHQAIYGFRGSDVDSINNFCKILQGTGKEIKTFPLTVTRRCPKKVVALAQTHVPEFTAHPDAKDGEVIYSDTDQVESLYRPGDMVICRCNAPLTRVAFRLVKRGVKAVIRGRDIGQGLVALIQKLRAKDVNDLLRKLDEWSQKECAKVAGTRREETATQGIVDRAECIRTLCEDASDVSELCARISSIFDNFEATGAPKQAVILSSIHRAKGLEADRVFWLMPEIECRATQDWQLVQEDNLRYVAITRAKQSLFLVHDASTSEKAPKPEPQPIQVTRGQLAAELEAHNIDPTGLEALIAAKGTAEATAEALTKAGMDPALVDLCEAFAICHLRGW